MKKKAYTLAEVLIALSVVGIIAAICIPMANKFRPDTSKILYLQTHDNLKQVLLRAAHNSAYYPEVNGDFSFKYHPLANIASIDNSEISQRNKLCRVLADALVLSPEDNNVNCSDNYTPFNGNNFSRSFTLKNGVEVMVTTNSSFDTVAAVQQTKTNRYNSEIVIDINGTTEGPNCLYGEDCTNPDIFLFRVSADGSLRAIDYAGLYYTKHRINLKKGEIVNDETVENILARNNRDLPLFAIPLVANNNDDEPEDGDPDDGDPDGGDHEGGDPEGSVPDEGDPDDGDPDGGVPGVNKGNNGFPDNNTGGKGGDDKKLPSICDPTSLTYNKLFCDSNYNEKDKVEGNTSISDKLIKWDEENELTKKEL